MFDDLIRGNSNDSKEKSEEIKEKFEKLLESKKK